MSSHLSGDGRAAGVRRASDLTHAELAVLGREWLLAGHLIDRAGMPQVIARSGRELMEAVAIDEWMGASPVYTRRMQRALGFTGDDVATMFKGMQLDIGAPPEFLDFRFTVHGADRGEFHLDHCGALLDVEPMGDEFVHGMCHTIEDPTFEATACASNPRARLTPVHRPPRLPADRHPHCHWEVRVDAGAVPLSEPAAAAPLAASLAARVELSSFGGSSGDDRGRDDYAGDLDPDLRLEDFSRRALSLVVQEAALQGHLLVMSFLAAVGRRLGPGAVADVGDRQAAGVAGVVAGRLARALGAPPTPAGVAQVLELHPALQPAPYVARRVDVAGGVVLVELEDCPALEEPELTSWLTLLRDGHDRFLTTLARGVDPAAEVERTDARHGGRLAWEVRSSGTAHDEDPDVTLTRFSGGAEFAFRRTGRRGSVADADGGA